MEQMAEQNRILKEKEYSIRAKENQSKLQANWVANNDCTYNLRQSKIMWEYTDEYILGRQGSVPDLTTFRHKSIIGQGYPFGDFLRPVDEDALTWNSDLDMASTISANSTHSSSSNLTTWSNSSTTTCSTLPLKCEDGRNTVLKMIDAYKATKRFKTIMRNYLVEMDRAEKEGGPTQWNMPNSSVKVL